MEVLKSFGFERDKPKPDLSFREKRELGGKMKDIREETEKELSKFLSDKQMDVYREIQEESRDKFRERMQERG